MYREDPHNGMNIIDSRDIIARLDELEDMKEDGDLDEDELEELEALSSFAEEASNCASDWIHGATLIRDSYFETYAQQLAEDIGSIPTEQSWPAYHIDWEAAADDLKQDYRCVDFDGEEYWVR